MNLVDAIKECRTSGKNFKAKSGEFECTVEYDKKDKSVSVDYFCSTFGGGHFIPKEFSEKDIEKVVNTFLSDVSNLEYKPKK